MHNWKEPPGNIFEVRVTPKASFNKIKVEEGSNVIRIYVTAAPENDKANKAVIDLLSKELGVPKSSLTIIRGQTSRNKSIKLSS